VTDSFSNRRVGNRLTLAALGAALIAFALVAPSGAPAAPPGAKPTITGTTVVGQTLTASATASGTGVYKWERCDPAISADCSGSAGTDSNWVTVAGGNGVQTYTLTAADLGAFIRVQAHDTVLGSQGFVASDPVGPVLAPPPGTAPSVLPEHGVHLLGETTEGTVKFKPPGAKNFSPLVGVTVIPVGSIINTRRGTILLTAATGELGNRDPDNSMEFFDGLFKIKQGAATDAPAIAKLMGKLSCGDGGKKSMASASSGPQAVAAGRRKRRLWGRGSGSYGTAGGGGTGSVVGTTWLTKETCNGTFFKVTEGVGIVVDAKGKKKDVFLEPGETYFAED
jgi:hypothetical protein